MLLLHPHFKFNLPLKGSHNTFLKFSVVLMYIYMYILCFIYNKEVPCHLCNDIYKGFMEISCH
uniref:Uncharacterized protein n=1 Tax=Rhizophora mucronata TaxID=61149 RepID=A0A2P2JJR7_RHIMU